MSVVFFSSALLILASNSLSNKADWNSDLDSANFKADRATFVASEKNFKAQVGGVGYLRCSILNASNFTVAWLRVRDSHILTVDTETFISDVR